MDGIPTGILLGTENFRYFAQGMTRVYEIPEESGIASALPEVLSGLPGWRLEKALSFRRDVDRFLCGKSFLLLEDLLRERFGLSRCPEFSYGSSGKPFLKDYPDIFFNISHCRKGIAVAVSDSPVGIDIEEIQFDQDLAAAVLSPDEFAAVISSEDPAIGFTEIWTRKESFLKLTGEGLRDNMKDVLATAGGVRFRTEVRRAAGCIVTVASNR